jgi:hypothetical protein
VITALQLKEILEVCASHSVASIKMPELEVSFVPLGSREAQAPVPASDPLEGLRKQEESIPPDLRADDLMNADKVLNWSSPDGDPGIPLAGEQEL